MYPVRKATNVIVKSKVRLYAINSLGLDLIFLWMFHPIMFYHGLRNIIFQSKRHKKDYAISFKIKRIERLRYNKHSSRKFPILCNDKHLPYNVQCILAFCLTQFSSFNFKKCCFKMQIMLRHSTHEYINLKRGM